LLIRYCSHLAGECLILLDVTAALLLALVAWDMFIYIFLALAAGTAAATQTGGAAAAAEYLWESAEPIFQRVLTD
jgi:hypothetical protein